MEDRGNKTIMCSVFFLDIVAYSKKSVAGQISLKERFNSYLSEAIRDVPVADRIILDTGDGAAINFLGDVEDALKAALSLRESLLKKEDPGSDNPLLVRMGINLGPVRLVRDINGQPNIVGDGINVAQRVMGFADAGQVLVSRSYYDAVSRLSHQYAEMFHYQGSRTDKHVREHEVYAIGYPGELAPKVAPVVVADDGWAAGSSFLWGRFRQVWNAAALRLDKGVAAMLARIGQLEPRQRLIYAGVAVALLLIAVLALKLASPDDVQNGSSQAVVQPVSAVMASVSEEQAAMEKNAEPVRTEPVQAKKKDAAQKPVEKRSIDSKAENKKTAVQSKAPVATNGGGLFDPVERGADGFISVSCKDGSQVFVDGSQKGKVGTGALTLAVAPGKHTVIVSHSAGGISTQSVDVVSGKTVRIRPGFCGQ
ncbi:MAG: adenylate/guanylate cyclase domain-containing protein [Gallionella sp.]|jgi:type II secretory pathway component PulM|nr:adenylate/guanylate cyclase domain-containing protein [Gallionella sp.]MCK9355389.1 adenylate/guanylate cyclase domain-containing protein [Gallionella sp.]